MATKTREERRAARAAKKQEAANRQNEGSCGSSALDRQVGGTHYLSGIQHVEFCQVNRIPWCEAASIKYIIRHRKKNGKQDVEKAIHYLELLMAIDYARLEDDSLKVIDMSPRDFKMKLEDFLKANEVPELESKCVTNICNHQVGGGDGGKDGLMDTIKLLKSILKTYEADVPEGMDLL